MFKLIAMLGALAFSASSFAAKYSIEAFFNNSPDYEYTDPYRNITRKGQNLEKVIIDVIRSAKSSVHLAVQELRLPLIASELIKKHKEGVRVRVVLENSYNNTINESSRALNPDTGEYEASKYVELFALIDVNGNRKISNKELNTRDAIFMLRKAGIQIKDDTSDGSSGSELMHHKFLVIDGKSLVVSTANFTMSGIHGDMLVKSSRGNANSLLKINSPQLAKMFNEEFALMWGGKKHKGRFGQSKGYRGVMKTSIRKSKVLAQFSPTSRTLGWDKSVNGTIGSQLAKAKKSIKMALFVFSDQNLANILRKNRTSNRKLDIQLLIEPKFAAREYSELLDMWGLQLRNQNCDFELRNSPWKSPLKTAGIPSLPRGDVLHHKFAVLDNETVIVGSQNWSDAANNDNDENILVIKDKHIASLYAQEFDRLYKFSNLGPSRALIRRIDNLEQLCSSAY